MHHTHNWRLCHCSVVTNSEGIAAWMTSPPSHVWDALRKMFWGITGTYVKAHCTTHMRLLLNIYRWKKWHICKRETWSYHRKPCLANLWHTLTASAYYCVRKEKQHLSLFATAARWLWNNPQEPSVKAKSTTPKWPLTNDHLYNKGAKHLRWFHVWTTEVLMHLHQQTPPHLVFSGLQHWHNLHGNGKQVRCKHKKTTCKEDLDGQKCVESRVVLCQHEDW